MHSDVRNSAHEELLHKKLLYLEKLKSEQDSPQEFFKKKEDEIYTELKEIHGENFSLEEWRNAMDASIITPDSPWKVLGKALDKTAAISSEVKKEPVSEPMVTSPVYIPPREVRQRWRSEAKLAFEANGDHSDHPRRTLVLLDSVEELLDALEQMGITVTAGVKTEAPQGRARQTTLA